MINGYPFLSVERISDFGLTYTQTAIIKNAREFAKKKIKPLVSKMEKEIGCLINPNAQMELIVQ